MTATINLSIDVPSAYNVALLKQQIMDYAKFLVTFDSHKEKVDPYTIEELQDRVAESEAQFAAGEFYTQDEVHQMMDSFMLSQDV